jgi:hypothetical protein
MWTNKRKKKFVETSETIEGFCFVIFVSSLSRPNTGIIIIMMMMVMMSMKKMKN